MTDCDDEFVVHESFLEWMEKGAGLCIQRGRHACKYRHLALCLWVQVPRLQKKYQKNIEIRYERI